MLVLDSFHRRYSAGRRLSPFELHFVWLVVRDFRVVQRAGKGSVWVTTVGWIRTCDWNRVVCSTRVSLDLLLWRFIPERPRCYFLFPGVLLYACGSGLSV